MVKITLHGICHSWTSTGQMPYYLPLITHQEWVRLTLFLWWICFLNGLDPWKVDAIFYNLIDKGLIHHRTNLDPI